MEKILKSKAKIRFQDCDPFNHLNNARYIDYMINAREDHLIDNYDLDVFEISRTTGQGWVVASNQIAYFSPAYTMETVMIDSQLIRFTRKNLLVEIRMWNESQTKMKALLWANFIHIDFKTSKAINHSPEFLQFAAGVLVPIEQAVFEERIIAVNKTRKEDSSQSANA
jgi:YbgC/YbaW family acyl-CoA thioester hydrolase